MALIPILVDLFLNPVIQLIAVLSTFGIGLFQGIILGRAILIRFPRLQNRVKTVSFTMFGLFLINAILSVRRQRQVQSHRSMSSAGALRPA